MKKYFRRWDWNL